MCSSRIGCNNINASVWDYLALSSKELERADLIALNLAAARGIRSLHDLDVPRYLDIVDEWTADFARRLPAAESYFWKMGPEKWKNDIRFYRIGMLQLFLGNVIGIRYSEEEKRSKEVRYTDPSSLFLNGLIDTKIGTCANMATLHVAISRRMGWPVSLALVNIHQLSRFDDGQVVYNIESSDADPNSFSAGSDEEYIKRFNLSKKAIECGANLRRLTAREMMGVFIAGRARHYQDIGELHLQDLDCCLARHLLPNHRPLYTLAMAPFLERGKTIFDPDEHGHPARLHRELCRTYGGPKTL
jgi:hypothetical protein